MGHQPGVVVEEGEGEGLALGLRVGRVGQLGAVEAIRLPEIAEMLPLEAAEGGSPSEQAGAGGAAGSELAAEGARGDALFGHRAGRFSLEDVGDGAGGARGELAFEGLGAVQGFGRQGA